MKNYTHNGYNIRIMESKQELVYQVNIFNPEDAGHSFAFFVPVENKTDEDTVFNFISTTNLLTEKCVLATNVFQNK